MQLTAAFDHKTRHTFEGSIILCNIKGGSHVHSLVQKMDKEQQLINRMPHFTMDQLHCWIISCVLLLCLTVNTCSATTIYGFEGQDVILPCKYDSHYHGVCDICWMRGSIPTNGCGAQILYANEKEVVMRDSVRYQLNGMLQNGDASLTIHNARKSDSGQYSCRVHVPGWFNDKRFEVYLAIRAATQRTSTVGYVSTTTHNPTTGPVSTMQHETTTISEQVTTKHTETLETNSTTVGYITISLIPTQGHALTTQNAVTPAPEHVATKHPGSFSTTQNETTNSPDNVTTKHTGPALTTQHETRPAGENVTTNHSVDDTDDPFKENNKHVKEVPDVFPAIWVPVILILLVVGISALYLITKHKRRFRSTLETTKNSSTFVSYNNLDNSLTLPMTNSSNN